MKKLTILLFVIMFIVYGVRYYQFYHEPENCGSMKAAEVEMVNCQIYHYESVKIRGSSVKDLFNLVDNLNEQNLFPYELRYGDEVLNSYKWTANENEYINSGDFELINDLAYFEIVMTDNNSDAYLDTITIHPYDEWKITDNSVIYSGE